MKKINLISAFVLFLLISYSCSVQETEKENTDFTFAFMTDIHLQPERGAAEGFMTAIRKVNELKPDFVITGGDLIMDALGVSYGRADSLYAMYDEMLNNFHMPVYNTLGNHELFGIYKKSGINPYHPEYNYGMFQKWLGDTYYSFDHNGWHFIVLNSIMETKDRRYIGMVDEEQIEWIKRDLLDVDPETPIVISTHIPFITVFTQVLYGEYAPEYHGLVVENSKDVLDLFMDHNLKLVLQGHLHYLEDIKVNGVNFITVGAVSARWWSGPNHGVEEGFLMISTEDDDFDYEYIDYGWEVK